MHVLIIRVIIGNGINGRPWLLSQLWKIRSNITLVLYNLWQQLLRSEFVLWSYLTLKTQLPSVNFSMRITYFSTIILQYACLVTADAASSESILSLLCCIPWFTFWCRIIKIWPFSLKSKEIHFKNY